MEQRFELSYYPEGDLLEVIFDTSSHCVKKTVYRLRDGLMLFVAVDSAKPVQLTIVNYHRLVQMPTFYFNGWKRLKAADRKKLLPALNSPLVSAFVKLDTESGYGYLPNHSMLKAFLLAA